MQLTLENLEYQEQAIQSVVKVFDGNARNTFDNATFEGIRSNFSDISSQELQQNIKSVADENGILPENIHLTDEAELSIEMETGTGKTLVYVNRQQKVY